MNSLYAALLQAAEDEATGAASLPTDEPVLEPGGQPATVEEMQAEPVITPPSEPPPAAPAVKAAPAAPEAPKSFRDYLMQYGLSEKDVTPLQRTPNSSSFAADIGRAGNTIGAAFAGTKPDSSFYDNMEKRGAGEAAGRDAAMDSATKFKQQFMLKVGDDKKAAKSAAMKDPSSPEYLAAVAQIKGDPDTSKRWDKVVAEARGFGVVPDPELFIKNFKMSQAVAQQGADSRTEKSQAGADRRMGLSQDFRREMVGTEATIRIAQTQYQSELKKASEARDAYHPNRIQLGPVDIVDARKMRALDTDAQFILGQIDLLREEIRKHGNDVLRVIPGFRGTILSVQQSIASAILRANEYGVPNGRDWEMVYKELGDPTKFVDLVTNQQDDQVLQAGENIRARTEAKAREVGYGPYASGSGKAQELPKPVAPDVRSIVEGAPAPGQASAPPTATEVDPNKMIRVQDGDKQFRIPARAVQKWISNSPKTRKALE